jgi:cytochrome c553
MKAMTRFFMIFASLALVPVTVNAGDAAAGASKAVTCIACHGKEGISIAPTYPNLACQKEQYLVNAIKDYKSGARNNPMMKPMVASLSDSDVENLAAFFSTLNCK